MTEIELHTNQTNNNNDDEVEDVKTDNVQWDYCLMFGNLEPPKDKEGNQFAEDHPKTLKFREIEKKRKQLVKRLKGPSIGLTVARKRATDGKSIFILITASQERLEKQAEAIELKMKLTSEYGGGYSPFEVEDRLMFDGADKEFGFFRTNQRHLLIDSILQSEAAYGGADIRLSKLVKAGVITKVFPIHEAEPRKELLNGWAHYRAFLKYQPLDEIRNYFGEEYAFYFGWLGFYTTWLWGASILGLIAFICHVADRGDGVSDYGIWIISVYAIFLGFWATLFLEYWKRFGNELAFRWGMMDYEDDEIQRPDFKGVDQHGVYVNGHWVTLDPTKDYGFPLPKPQKYYPTLSRKFKISASLPLLATMVVSVVIGTLAVLSFRLFVQKSVDSFWGALIGGVVNAMTIIFMNVIWKRVAVILTEWENHRTQSEFDNNLIVKIFVFYFVNSYTSLYYIAFFKNGFKFWGSPDLNDACKVGVADDVIGWGCVDELTFQLATILITNIVFGQAREVAIPFLISQIQLLRYKKQLNAMGEDSATASLPQFEKDSKLANDQGTFDEYSEMVIQFGYITLFAAGFPLAPMLAVVNNMIEIRTDAFKLITSVTRPVYKGATGIGNWYGVLEILGIIAVITNCLLMGFSFDAIARLLSKSNFHTLAAIVIIEHAVLFIKYVISVLVPDVPGYIVKEVAYQQWVKEQIIKKVTGVNQKPEVQAIQDDDLNDVEIEEKNLGSIFSNQ